jgi:hypothetical protein
VLLTNPALRLDLARRGRPYVERYHDHVVVSRNMLNYLLAPSIDSYQYRPTFFASKYRLPEGLRLPSYLKRLTAQVVQRYGLPEGITPEDLAAHGLL